MFKQRRRSNFSPAMKAVILAAGRGTRLFGGGFPKVLVKVAGRELLWRHLRLLSERGVDEFIVVVNPENEGAIRRALEGWGYPSRVVVNPEPERGNGYSLLQAREHVDGPFILVMGDHVYEEAFLDEAMRGRGIVVDGEASFIDKEEATKVVVQDGHVRDIGKGVQGDLYDTGFFLLDPSVFDHAQRVLEEKGSVEMADVVRRAALPYTEVRGRFWMDIDTSEDLRKATRAIVRRSVKPTGDGLVSRLFNRRLSLLLTERVVDHLTPNQATLLSTLVGLLAALLALLSPSLGGILYQLSSVLDGTDGEIARSSLRESPLGGWVDSVLDRVVDFCFLLSLGLYLGPEAPWEVLSGAIFGSLMVSYTSERYRGATGRDLYQDHPQLLYLGGKRDERVFLIMVFCLLGLLRECLWVLALWTNARWALTLGWVGFKGHRAKK